jgi:NADH:ubiquinone oxidoreductase subunit C
MYREALSGAAQLGQVVADTCHIHEPLGAYATSERVNYLFLDRDGVLDITSERSAADICRASVASEYPLFDWDEREMRDTYGAALSGLPNARPLFITLGLQEFEWAG